MKLIVWISIAKFISVKMILVMLNTTNTCCSMMSLLIIMISLNMLACSSRVAWNIILKTISLILDVDRDTVEVRMHL